MNIDKGLIGGSTTLMLLALLKTRDMYGYEIIKELELLSESTFAFKEGTLYPVLHKLENGNLVKSYKKAGENGRERKYYQITKKGLLELEEQKAMWQTFSESVEKVVGGCFYVYA